MSRPFDYFGRRHQPGGPTPVVVVTTSPADPVEVERFRAALKVAADRILDAGRLYGDPVDWDRPESDDLAGYVTRKLDAGMSTTLIAAGADAHDPETLAARLTHAGYVTEAHRLLDKHYSETLWGATS